jgi:hypothetical protein
MRKWDLLRVEETPTEHLQQVLHDCFECGVELKETPLVEAIAHELVHRTRYNLNPEKRFSGETK